MIVEHALECVRFDLRDCRDGIADCASDCQISGNRASLSDGQHQLENKKRENAELGHVQLLCRHNPRRTRCVASVCRERIRAPRSRKTRERGHRDEKKAHQLTNEARISNRGTKKKSIQSDQKKKRKKRGSAEISDLQSFLSRALPSRP